MQPLDIGDDQQQAGTDSVHNTWYAKKIKTDE
jgi:hypothetical protein